jgi:hypothetical protein
MGTWGAGLYQDDTASDLKSAVDTLLRTPLDIEDVLATLKQVAPQLQRPRDEEYSSCWFVLADRFHRYGVQHDATDALVRSLVEDHSDLNVMARRGMTKTALVEREKVLQNLLRKLETPHPKPLRRGSMARPQDYVMELGEVVAYPTDDNGWSANPYYKDWATQKFSPTSYKAVVVVDRGRAFGFLAWYAVLLLRASWREVPSLAQCLEVRAFGPAYGTLSRAHRRKMAIQELGRVHVDQFQRRLTSTGDSFAIDDISLSNPFSFGEPNWAFPLRPRLGEIVQLM